MFRKLLLIILLLSNTAALSNLGEHREKLDEIATCITLAAHQYRLDPFVLLAIKYVESSNWLQVAPRQNSNGTWDLGLMQINTVWESILSENGISRSDLEEPCKNITVGAWILAKKVDRHGLWDGVGRYHSATPHLSQRYSDKVKAVWKELKARQLYLESNESDWEED